MTFEALMTYQYRDVGSGYSRVRVEYFSVGYLLTTVNSRSFIVSGRVRGSFSSVKVACILLRRKTRSVLEWAPCLHLSNQRAGPSLLLAGLTIPSMPMTVEEYFRIQQMVSPLLSLEVSYRLIT